MRYGCVSILAACLLASGCNPKGGKDQGSGTPSQGPDAGDSADDGDDNVPTPGSLVITGKIDAVDADTAVAFSVTGTQLGGGQGDEHAIDSGTLAINVKGGAALDEDGSPTSTVIMVLKEGETRLDAFDSMLFVSAPTSGKEEMLSFATSSAKVEALDLGTIAQGGEDLVSSNGVGTEQFDLEEDKLTEMAKLDDAMRVLKNTYANSPEQGPALIGGAQEFYWSAPLLSALNTESDSAAVAFDGWSPQLHISDPDFDLDSLCTGSKSFVFEIPPPGVKRDLDDATYLTQITNTSPTMNPDGNSCGAGAGVGNAFIKRDNATSTNLYMNFGGGEPFQSAIPKGAWAIKLDGAVRAKLDLAVSHPLIEDPDDATKMVPRVYIPAITVTTNATGVVEKVELWFYLYDKISKTFVKVTNYETMRNTVAWAAFSMDGRMGAENVSDGMDTTLSYAKPVDDQPVKIKTTFGREWRLRAGDDQDCPVPTTFARLESVGVQFEMYANRYSTTFALPRAFGTPSNCP